MSRPFILILGGTRSGKSRLGIERASALAGAGTVVYLATALPGDPELDRRIDGHRRARPASWPVLEVGTDLGSAVRSVGATDVILLDGLSLWLSALVAAGPFDLDGVLAGPVADAESAFAERPGPLVVVDDEVGLGTVPMHPLAREFRDLLGIVHQRFAAAADDVYLVVAGLPLALKSG